jgi:hypothetical protein
MLKRATVVTLAVLTVIAVYVLGYCEGRRDLMRNSDYVVIRADGKLIQPRADKPVPEAE